jgi:hypothetical protein
MLAPLFGLRRAGAIGGLDVVQTVRAGRRCPGRETTVSAVRPAWSAAAGHRLVRDVLAAPAVHATASGLPPVRSAAPTCRPGPVLAVLATASRSGIHPGGQPDHPAV